MTQFPVFCHLTTSAMLKGGLNRGFYWGVLQDIIGVTKGDTRNLYPKPLNPNGLLRGMLGVQTIAHLRFSGLAGFASW